MILYRQITIINFNMTLILKLIKINFFKIIENILISLDLELIQHFNTKFPKLKILRWITKKKKK